MNSLPWAAAFLASTPVGRKDERAEHNLFFASQFNVY